MSRRLHDFVAPWKVLGLVWLAGLCVGCAPWAGRPGTAQNGRFDFALIGDVPYNEQDATNAFPHLIAELNRAALEFVVHDGDIKSGASPCSDEILLERQAQFQTFDHPLIYVFGDNEWTDCARTQTNSFDPVERLNKLREIFTRGDHSLGKRALTLARQSDDPRFKPFRENVRWSRDEMLFVGLNVPGDSNNYGQPEYAATQKELHAELKRLRTELKVTEQDPPESLPLPDKRNSQPAAK